MRSSSAGLEHDSRDVEIRIGADDHEDAPPVVAPRRDRELTSRLGPRRTRHLPACPPERALDVGDHVPEALAGRAVDGHAIGELAVPRGEHATRPSGARDVGDVATGRVSLLREHAADAERAARPDTGERSAVARAPRVDVAKLAVVAEVAAPIERAQPVSEARAVRCVDAGDEARAVSLRAQDAVEDGREPRRLGERAASADRPELGLEVEPLSAAARLEVIEHAADIGVTSPGADERALAVQPDLARAGMVGRDLVHRDLLADVEERLGEPVLDARDDDRADAERDERDEEPHAEHARDGGTEAHREELGTRPRRASIARDERGAVMVIGAFMAIFLVGLLYHLLGIGEAVVLQERLQDAADTGAFAAAARHARAMNLIGLVNASMLVLMASLEALNLVQIATLVCVELGYLPHGACEDLDGRHTTIHDTASEPLLRSYRRGSQAMETLVEVTPRLAAADVELIIRENYADMAITGFLVPHEMPLARSDSDPVCALANLHVFDLAELALGDLLEELLGPGFPRVERDVIQCEEISGDGPQIPIPPNLPVYTEPWQLRVVVIGNAEAVANLGSGVRVPSQVIGADGEETRPWVDAGEPDPTRTFVVAQSEYYSTYPLANQLDDTELHSVEEDVFRMMWRARLRRFRVPTGASADPADMEAAYRDWVFDALLPACGASCAGLGDSIMQANHALH